MSLAGIQFGATAWRGVIGDDFTFGRVRAAAAAIARSVRAKRKHPKLLVAGDTRFFSDEFARAAAGTLEAEGVGALLADRAMPAAAVSFEILRRKLDGGLYVTGGRYPAEYSGLEFFGADGVAAGHRRAAEMERVVENPAEKERDPGETQNRKFEIIDPTPAYFEKLGKLVRFDAIRSARIALAYDAMHGAGAGWLDRLLAAAGVPVEILNADRDVLFDGRAPDPAPANLDRLANIVGESGAALGLATDGAGRRFGILDGRGRFVPPGLIFGLLYNYLIESRGWRLGVGHGAAASQLADAVARRRRLPIYDTPSGFASIAPLLSRDQVAAGVGEDGGFTIRGHVPEGDGILACLLVAEMVAERGPIDAQWKKLSRHLGAEYRPAAEEAE